MLLFFDDDFFDVNSLLTNQLQEVYALAQMPGINLRLVAEMTADDTLPKAIVQLVCRLALCLDGEAALAGVGVDHRMDLCLVNGERVEAGDTGFPSWGANGHVGRETEGERAVAIGGGHHARAFAAGVDAYQCRIRRSAIVDV